LCPKEFKEQARKLLRTVARCNPGINDEGLRKALFKFTGDFANWDLASNRTWTVAVTLTRQQQAEPNRRTRRVIAGSHWHSPLLVPKCSGC
jgi:hypothetical protein